MTDGTDTALRGPETGLGLWLDRLHRLLTGLAVLCLIGIVGDVAVGVISRYVFNASFTWTEELGSLLYIWMIFIAMPLALRHGGHVAISFLRDRLTGRWRRVNDFIIDSIVASALITLLFSGQQIYEISSGLLPGLQWPNALRFISVPASCGISLLFLIFLRGHDLRNIAAGASAVVLGIAVYWLIFRIDVVSVEGISPSLLMCLTGVIALLLGVPVVFALLIGAFMASWSDQLLPPVAVVHTVVTGGSKFLILAIPFFLTAGYLMNTGGLTTRLIALALSLVGHFRGGLAQVNVLTSLLFGGLSGSSSADAAGTSKVLVPEMATQGYSTAFSCAVTASSSILANVIPPAIAMLVFASLAEVSVGRLFLAGIVPGIVLALSMMLMVYVLAVRRGYGAARTRAGTSEILTALGHAAPSLLLPVLVIGSIRFGIMTATEAGVVAVLWALFLGKVLYRSYSWPELYRNLCACATDAGIIGLLIAAAAPFGWVLIAEQIPQQLMASVLHATSEKIAVLLLMNIAFLLLGTVLETVASMLIVVPLFLPLMIQLGVDPIHFGIIVIVNLMLGTLTPPIGLLVFITSSVMRIAPGKVFREVMPFLAVLIGALILITYVPTLSLFLAR